MLQDAVKVINFIKNHALNSRLFSNLCKNTSSNFTTLLLHAEKRWLSRGQSLKRLLLLKDEIEIVLTERNVNFLLFFKMTCGYPSCVICQIFLRYIVFSRKKIAIYLLQTTKLKVLLKDQHLEKNSRKKFVRNVFRCRQFCN